MTVYSIAKWRETFETADSRKHRKLYWVALPIDCQSSGYQSLIEEYSQSIGDRSSIDHQSIKADSTQFSAAEMYGAWCALLTIAAQCPERGKLANSKGEPVSMLRIARLTFLPQTLIEELFRWATRPEIGWILPTQSIDDRSSIDCRSITDRSTERNGTERNGTKQKARAIENDDDARANGGVEASKLGTRETRFDRFWHYVHVRTGKKAAKAAYAVAERELAGARGISTTEAGESLTEAMRAFAASPQASPTDHSPIHPRTWLSQGRYDDDRSSWGMSEQDIGY